uniref:Ig-like domain-containing protein n=1 Tax=Echeneis naucrates TaxID=173247 RepID=A0A665W5D7_ECHNA
KTNHLMCCRGTWNTTHTPALGVCVTPDRLNLYMNTCGEATIECNQKKGPTYIQMYWYRQLPGETMKLVVFTRMGNEKHDFGGFNEEKFSATKPNAESGTFTVKNLEPEDTGWYFCAVSEHSDTDTCES